MNIAHGIGKLFQTIGGTQDFLPNKILHAFGLPNFTSPMHMFGDFLKDPKGFQFGKEEGNNMKLGALAAAAYVGLPYLAHMAGIGGGAASGSAATADVGAAAALPSGTTAAMGGPTGELLSMFGQGSTATAPSQGLIGDSGAATGVTGAGDAAPAAGTKPMNPIVKSFLDNFMKERMQKPKWEPPRLTPMGRSGNPGR